MTPGRLFYPGTGELPSVLLIGVVPNKDGRTARGYFMRCTSSGCTEFFIDPCSEALLRAPDREGD